MACFQRAATCLIRQHDTSTPTMCHRQGDATPVRPPLHRKHSTTSYSCESGDSITTPFISPSLSAAPMSGSKAILDADSGMAFLLRVMEVTCNLIIPPFVPFAPPFRFYNEYLSPVIQALAHSLLPSELPPCWTLLHHICKVYSSFLH